MVYHQQTNTAQEGAGIPVHLHLQVGGSLLQLLHGSLLVVHSQPGSHHPHHSRLGNLPPHLHGNHLLQRHRGKQTQSLLLKRPGSPNYQVAAAIKLDRFRVAALPLVAGQILLSPRINSNSPAAAAAALKLKQLQASSEARMVVDQPSW